MLRQFGENVPDLPGRLALTVDDLGKSCPDLPVVVQVREIHLFVRQFPELLKSLLLGNGALFHVLQNLLDIVFSHIIYISFSICRDSFRICCMRIFRSSIRRATV